MTERKKFNFYRSYYDVFNAIETSNDKLLFISALLNRQFTGVEPIGLTGMAKFAYMSQKHSIDTQVNGYQDKTGIELTPTQGGTQGGTQAPSLQPTTYNLQPIIYKQKDHLSISFDEFNKLVDEFGIDKSEQTVNDVLNYRKNSKYKSLYLTALKWLKKDKEKVLEIKTGKPKLAI